MRRWWVIALSAMLVAGCSDPDTPRRAGDPHSLTIGITQYPSTLHPIIQTMVAKSVVLGMVTRSLSTIDHDWQRACGLCTELPTIDNGGAELATVIGRDGDPVDGVRVRWELKPGLYWGDGTPVTTRDFVFTWEVGRHPQSGAISMEIWRMIREIEVVDERTMVFHLDRRNINYNNLWVFTPIPEHLERDLFEAAPAEYMNRTRYQTEPTHPGLYLGPYVVAETARGSHVRLTRNPHWRGKAPAFDTITLRTLERTTTLEANLLSGNLDMILGELGMSIDQALAFERRHGEAYQIIYEPGLLYEHIDLNLDNPALADRRVRQALMYALDREQMVEQLFDGRQQVARSFVHPMDFPYTADVPVYTHDLERADALLNEAGWQRGTDGMRRNADGVALQFELMTTAGDRLRELVQQVLQSQWRAAGIDIRIRNEAPRIFFGETTRKRAFSAMALFAWSTQPEPVPRTTLHSSEIPTAENNWAGQNHTGYVNPEMDALVEAVEAELSAEARLPIWARMQEIYATDLPVLPMYFRTNVHILPPWLEGMRPTGHIITSTNWIEDWTRGQ
jgi:peptide/nickel transport system substrate-binding protein